MLPSVTCLLAIVSTLLVVFTQAVKFDLPAALSDGTDTTQRCLSQFVAKDTQVLITVNTGEGYNQRIDLEVIVQAVVTMVRTLNRIGCNVCRSPRMALSPTYILGKEIYNKASPMHSIPSLKDSLPCASQIR